MHGCACTIAAPACADLNICSHGRHLACAPWCTAHSVQLLAGHICECTRRRYHATSWCVQGVVDLWQINACRMLQLVMLGWSDHNHGSVEGVAGRSLLTPLQVGSLRAACNSDVRGTTRLEISARESLLPSLCLYLVLPWSASARSRLICWASARRDDDVGTPGINCLLTRS